MSPNHTVLFYQNLPVQSADIQQILQSTECFQPVPADWYVVVTDIQGSTQAVMSGKQQLVNMIAAGSIISAINISKRFNSEIPFFFGGDGAVVLVPELLHLPVMQALQQHSANSMRFHQLKLRVGSLPLTEVYRHGCQVQLARRCFGAQGAVPVVMGNGLKYAESRIKTEQFNDHAVMSTVFRPDLQGLECRWNGVPPPEHAEEIVSLLVDVDCEVQQADIYCQVLDLIEFIYGPVAQRNPISPRKLSLQPTPLRILQEMYSREGRFSLSYFVMNFSKTLFALLYFRFFSSGRQYIQQLVERADTLIIDGRLATVISGTVKQRRELVQQLTQLEQQGKLVFGYYHSGESVLTCYVEERRDRHIHFVDGAHGGYTHAAAMLKQKLAAHGSSRC